MDGKEAMLICFFQREVCEVSWYLTIRPDAEYSRLAATASLAQFLASLPELQQTGPSTFEGAPAHRGWRSSWPEPAIPATTPVLAPIRRR